MNFKEQYNKKRTSLRQIAAQFQPGWSCVADIGLAVPYAICDAVTARAQDVLCDCLKDMTIHTLLDVRPLPFLAEGCCERLRCVSWFSGEGMRQAVNGGLADVMPGYYRDMPALFTDYIEIDSYIAVVSPMDKHGYFSTGCSASLSRTFMSKAKRIYLQVNKNMPRAISAPLIHISQVSALCEVDEDLPELETAAPDETSLAIASYIAGEIPNGSTLQLGIGAIPDAVGLALKHKRQLGIHTEMFTDSMVGLLTCGAADNSQKSIHRGKTVASFAFGSRRLYDYIDDNPSVEMLPVDYVNNPAVIAKHPNFMSVNSGLEVDFFGQVCAESIGTKHISGTGGQADYVRGAVQSSGGKSFIAFPSTAKNGTVSRIRPTLTPGAIVTTSKNDVDHIVTEYGIAKLRGRTLSQRTNALIAIAHPDFRDELRFAAKRQNILI